MSQNDPNPAENSPISPQLFLIEGDRARSSLTESEARHKEWDYRQWQKTGSSATRAKDFG